MMSNIQIAQIPAFEDNYLWLIHDDQHAIIVDPGDAVPVQAYLDQHHLQLSAILVTHHHADHIGGVQALLDRTPGIPVFGPDADQRSGRIAMISKGCVDGEVIHIDALNLDFTVIDVPGHTSTHIAFYSAALTSLFCGDTLFAGGCGRLFEGTPTQMLSSLNKLAALPTNTNIYCAHEYTLSNLRFAVAVEPDNAALQSRYQEVIALRAAGRSTVPSQLGTELQTNPFLRADSANIIHTLQGNERLGAVTDPVTVFAAARQWKNTF